MYLSVRVLLRRRADALLSLRRAAGDLCLGDKGGVGAAALTGVCILLLDPHGGESAALPRGLLQKQQSGGE